LDDLVSGVRFLGRNAAVHHRGTRELKEFTRKLRTAPFRPDRIKACDGRFI